MHFRQAVLIVRDIAMNRALNGQLTWAVNPIRPALLKKLADEASSTYRAKSTVESCVKAHGHLAKHF